MKIKQKIKLLSAVAVATLFTGCMSGGIHNQAMMDAMMKNYKQTGSFNNASAMATLSDPKTNYTRFYPGAKSTNYGSLALVDYYKEVTKNSNKFITQKINNTEYKYYFNNKKTYLNALQLDNSNHAKLKEMLGSETGLMMPIMIPTYKHGNFTIKYDDKMTKYLYHKLHKILNLAPLKESKQLAYVLQEAFDREIDFRLEAIEATKKRTKVNLRIMMNDLKHRGDMNEAEWNSIYNKRFKYLLNSYELYATNIADFLSDSAGSDINTGFIRINIHDGNKNKLSNLSNKQVALLKEAVKVLEADVKKIKNGKKVVKLKDYQKLLGKISYLKKHFKKHRAFVRKLNVMYKAVNKSANFFKVYDKYNYYILTNKDNFIFDKLPNYAIDTVNFQKYMKKDVVNSSFFSMSVEKKTQAYSSYSKHKNFVQNALKAAKDGTNYSNVSLNFISKDRVQNTNQTGYFFAPEMKIVSTNKPLLDKYFKNYKMPSIFFGRPIPQECASNFSTIKKECWEDMTKNYNHIWKDGAISKGYFKHRKDVKASYNQVVSHLKLIKDKLKMTSGLEDDSL